MGEGKHLDRDREVMTAAGASYGCRDFRAPEIRGSQGWTTKADVFSFGIICCKVIELHARICTASVPKALRKLIPDALHEKVMPERLKIVVENCLKRSPSERANIRPMITLLDELSLDFTIEKEDGPGTKIKWTTWDWRGAKAAARGFALAETNVFSSVDSIFNEGTL